VRPSEIDIKKFKNILVTERLIMPGFDKKGQAALVLKVRNHIPGQYPLEELTQYATAIVHRIVRKSER
jgi:hypothetical protein